MTMKRGVAARQCASERVNLDKSGTLIAKNGPASVSRSPMCFAEPDDLRVSGAVQFARLTGHYQWRALGCAGADSGERVLARRPSRRDRHELDQHGQPRNNAERPRNHTRPLRLMLHYLRIS
jgi:hypothetical protein